MHGYCERRDEHKETWKIVERKEDMKDLQSNWTKIIKFYKEKNRRGICYSGIQSRPNRNLSRFKTVNIKTMLNIANKLDLELCRFETAYSMVI